jgi:hypothetical protein
MRYPTIADPMIQYPKFGFSFSTLEILTLERQAGAQG